METSDNAIEVQADFKDTQSCIRQLQTNPRACAVPGFIDDVSVFDESKMEYQSKIPVPEGAHNEHKHELPTSGDKHDGKDLREGSWTQEPGSCVLGPRSWVQGLGTWGPGVWGLGPRPGAWGLGPGAWGLGPGAWHSGF